MSDEEVLPVIIDNGSETCKVGFGGDDMPRYVFPSIVGRPQHPGGISGMRSNTSYVGNDGQRIRALLNLSHPIKRGIITDWDDMEKIWTYVFEHQLHCESQKHPVLLTESPINPRANREKMTEIMFEKFNTPAMNIAMGAVLSLYASGKITGIILDSGEGASQVVPVQNCQAIKHAILPLDFAGSDLTDYLMRMLFEGGHAFFNSAEKEIIRGIKKKLCSVVLDFDHEMNSSNSMEESYELPDGQIVNIGNEKFRCPEALFQPCLLHKQSSGIHKAINDSITICDAEIRNELYGNIALSGGNTLFDGIAERMKREVSALAPSATTINVIAPGDIPLLLVVPF